MKENIDYYIDLYENAPIAYFSIGIDGVVRYCNKQAANMLGYRVDDLIGRPVFDLYADTPDGKEKAKKVFEKFRSGQTIRNEELQMQRLDGSSLWISLSVNALRDENGQIIESRSIAVDISEQKRLNTILMESEYKFRSLTEKSLVGVYIIQNNIIKYANPKFAEICEYSIDELIDKKGPKDLVHPEDWPIVEENIRKKIDGEEQYIHYEFRGITKNNKIRYLEVLSSITTFKGQPAIIGTVIDITDRKKNEEELFHARERLKGILDASTEIIFSKDRNGYYRDANITFSKLFARPIDEIIGKTDYDLFSKEDADRIRAIDQKVIEEKKIVKTEDHLKIKGQDHIFKVTKVPLRDAQGQVIGLAGFAEDITEERLYEKALRESEERYRKLVEMLPDGVFVDQDGCIVYMNPACARMLKIKDVNKIIGTPVISIIPPENQEKIRKRIQEAEEKFQPAPLIETQLVCYDGNRIDVESTGTSILFNGRPAVMITVRDITERKEAEKKLRQEQHLMKMFMANIPDAIYFKDLQGRFLRVNKAQATRLGLNDPAAAAGKTDFDFFDKDEAERSAQEHKQVIKKGKILSVERLKKDIHGNSSWIYSTQVPLKDEDGQIIGVFGITRDITEQKIREQELRKLSQAMEQSPLSVVITDVAGNIEYINPYFTKLTGYDKSEAIGKNPRILKSGEHPKEFYEELWQTITSGKIWHGQFHNKKKNGELYWEDVTIGPIFNEKGEITHFIGMKIDITEMKKAEDDLIYERELLQNLMDNIPDTIYFKDRQSRFIRVNKAHAREFRIKSPEEAVGKTDFDFFSEEHAREAFKDEQKIMATGKPMINKV